MNGYTPNDELNDQEKRAEQILQSHLSGYMGVISHAIWADLRSAITSVMSRPKKKRKRPRK